MEEVLGEYHVESSSGWVHPTCLSGMEKYQKKISCYFFHSTKLASAQRAMVYKYVETVLITFLNVKALGRKYTHSSHLKEDRTYCFWVLKISSTLSLKERHKFN